MPRAFLLPNRGVVEVKGPDATAFLQGLVTNDVEAARDGRAVYAALLTPQGKIIADFMIVPVPGGFWLDCASALADGLAARLRKYKLRAKVEVLDRTAELGVAALEDGTAAMELVVFDDPRLAALGRRAIGARDNLSETLSAAGYAIAPTIDYERRRIELGVPDSSDIEPETAFALDCNFEELHGVDFKKGCYVGQELTARMKHRATARKRFLPIHSARDLPPAGTFIRLDNADIGEIRSSLGTHGLALIRLDRLGAAKEAVAADQPIAIGLPAYKLILPQGETP